MVTEAQHRRKQTGDALAPSRVEVAVIGAGPVGLTAAIALASAGIETALVSKGTPGPDNRTTALLGGSVQALETLGVWANCRHQAAPLRAIRIIDDTRRLFRAPQVTFHAAEIGLDALGYNIENGYLLAALNGRAGQLPQLVRFEDEAQAIEIAESRVRVALASKGQLEAQLAIGADGRRSICRVAAGIAMDSFAYGQSALTANLEHSRPHDDVCTEFHTESGPFTLVPLPGRRSSLVCVVDPGESGRLASLAGPGLAEEIERRAHSLLGRILVEANRGIFPLRAETARRLYGNRVALIGEAAHVLPPIGAQGLNLGLRDAATIAEFAISARRRGADLGSTEMLEGYEAARRPDVMSRSAAIDLLNRSLLSDFLAIQGARGFGLYLMERIAPLRRALMREGAWPSLAAPRLMRGEPL